MTSSVEDTIGQMLFDLGVQAPLLDTVQWRERLYALAQQTESEERSRSLTLLEIGRKRVRHNRGRGWEAEWEQVEKEIEAGHQQLFNAH